MQITTMEAAAKRGYVDNIIEPDLIENMQFTLEMLFSKGERPAKKHGSI